MSKKGAKGKSSVSAKRKKKTSVAINLAEKLASNTNEKPSGIFAFTHYTLFVVFLYLINLFATDFTYFFGFYLDGFVARMVNVSLLMLPVVALFGLSYKKKWLYNYLMFVYLFSIFNSFTSLMLIMLVEEPIIIALAGYIVPLTIVAILMNMLTLWYVYEKKRFFTKFIGKTDAVDRFFKTMIHLFYFLLFLFMLVVVGKSFLGIYSNASDIVDDMSGMTFTQAQGYCDSVEEVEKGSICYLLVVAIFEDEPGREKLCMSIDADVYRQACLGVADR